MPDTFELKSNPVFLENGIANVQCNWVCSVPVTIQLLCPDHSEITLPVMPSTQGFIQRDLEQLGDYSLLFSDENGEAIENLPFRVELPPSEFTIPPPPGTTVSIPAGGPFTEQVAWTSQAQHTLLCVSFNDSTVETELKTSDASGTDPITDSFAYSVPQAGTYHFKLYEYYDNTKGCLLAGTQITAVLRTGTLQASAQEVTIPMAGTTATISWASNALKAQVFVLENGQAEVPVPKASPLQNGSVDYPLKVAGKYVFQLYDYSDGVKGERLGSPVTVTGLPSGAISTVLPPSPLPLEGSTIYIAWESSSRHVQVWAVAPGQTEQWVATAGQNSDVSMPLYYTLPQAGQYDFRLYDYSDNVRGRDPLQTFTFTTAPGGMITAPVSTVTLPQANGINPQVSYKSNALQVQAFIYLNNENIFGQTSVAHGIQLIEDTVGCVLMQAGAYTFELFDYTNDVLGQQPLDQTTVIVVAETCSPCVNSNCSGCLNSVCTGCLHSVCTGCNHHVCAGDYCPASLSCTHGICPAGLHVPIVGLPAKNPVVEIMESLVESGGRLLDEKILLPEIRKKWGALAKSQQKAVKMMWRLIQSPQPA
jgi:hypothetical protein